MFRKILDINICSLLTAHNSVHGVVAGQVLLDYHILRTRNGRNLVHDLPRSLLFLVVLLRLFVLLVESFLHKLHILEGRISR